MSTIVTDPYRAFNYSLELDGLQVAGFSEISGLEIQTEVETIQEGGVNYTVYKLPKQTSYSDLVLKRGLCEDFSLWNWYQQVIQGQIQTKNGTIYLRNSQGKNVIVWNFYSAYPIHWKGPLMDALQGTVAIQEFTLVTTKLEMKTASSSP